MDKSNFRSAPIGRLTPNALSVKNEREDWRASWHGQIGDVVNNPMLEGVVRVFGPGFCEELPSLVKVNRGSLDDY